MKKYIKLLLLVIVITLLVGCEQAGNPNLDLYLEKITIQNEVSTDFYLPRILNGEGDHIITWESSNEEIVTIGNITTITGLEYYIAEVNKDDKNHNVNLKSHKDMLDGPPGEKEFSVPILEDVTIKEEKINYLKDIISKYSNITVKENIKLPRATEKYGFELIWKSQNEDVISSTGEYKFPEQDEDVNFVVTALYNQVSFYEETIVMHVANKNQVLKEVCLDFVINFDSYGASWGSSYAPKEISNQDLAIKTPLTVLLSRANKQPAGNAISDRPVIATNSSTEYITIELGEGSFKSISFVLMQWNNKTFGDIHIEYFNGSSWVKCSDNITIPGEIKCDLFNGVVTKVRLSVYNKESKNTQLGLTSINFELN